MSKIAIASQANNNYKCNSTTKRKYSAAMLTFFGGQKCLKKDLIPKLCQY